LERTVPEEWFWEQEQRARFRVRALSVQPIFRALRTSPFLSRCDPTQLLAQNRWQSARRPGLSQTVNCRAAVTALRQKLSEWPRSLPTRRWPDAGETSGSEFPVEAYPLHERPRPAWAIRFYVQHHQNRAE